MESKLLNLQSDSNIPTKHNIPISEMFVSLFFLHYTITAKTVKATDKTLLKLE